MADRIEMMFSEQEVSDRIRELGQEITRDYAGKEITLICILKGASFFACELAKRIELPVQMEYMRCSSYGDETISSGVVKIVQDLDSPIRDKDVIVVEDIIDTGRTMHYLIKILKQREPASLKICSLLDKPDRRVADVDLDYVGFVIPDKFIVGYGLDYAQRYRNLPYIGIVILDGEGNTEEEIKEEPKEEPKEKPAEIAPDEKVPEKAAEPEKTEKKRKTKTRKKPEARK